MTKLGDNIVFPIYNENGTSFHNLVLRKATVDSVVMSLGDKITGDVYYKDSDLEVTMHEYIEYQRNEDEAPVKFVLVNPPTIVREGLVKDNSDLKGMTKYSFEFYHPMYQLNNIPFVDVAVSSDEEQYLSEDKKFSWIGYLTDFIAKLNKNLQNTEWVVIEGDRTPSGKSQELSDVLSFDKNYISDALKTAYDTWEVPFVIDSLQEGKYTYIDKHNNVIDYYSEGKRFVVLFGLPSNEIYETDVDKQLDKPFVFKFGQGVGLKNNSRTPKNNKVITRISGQGSESNIPYGYPQIPWYGNQDWDYTINNESGVHEITLPSGKIVLATSYPIYKGIVGGESVKLIKHPFTRSNLMPSIYGETLFNKVSPYLSTGNINPDFDPTCKIVDYYDAVSDEDYQYPNEINPSAPSYEIHEWEDIKPELDSEREIGIVSATPLDKDLEPIESWDYEMDDDGNINPSYFKIQLPVLSFDIYACAAITHEMQINMRSGACIGCTFNVQVDWDVYKINFYDDQGNFMPDGEQRDLTLFPKSNEESIEIILQKENSTFGTVMPDAFRYPKPNDLFVILGISMPLEYIVSAERRLDVAMKDYMLENNVYYFDYPLKFSEHFLVTHPYILKQIRNNTIIRFLFNQEELVLYVKQMTIKYGSGVLPQYDITLTDEIEVVLNQIGEVTQGVERMGALISTLREDYSRNVWTELRHKLSKWEDDTASGLIGFVKGLWVKAKGLFGIDENGDAKLNNINANNIVAKSLTAQEAHFFNLIIDEVKSAGGQIVISPANAEIVHVVKNDNWRPRPGAAAIPAYILYFKAESEAGKAITNQFATNDLVLHMEFNVTQAQTRNYWYPVVAGTYSEGREPEEIDLDGDGEDETLCHYIVVRQAGKDGSGVPQAGDDVVCLGNTNDTSRQNAIVLSAYNIPFIDSDDFNDDECIYAPLFVEYTDVNSYNVGDGNRKNVIARNGTRLRGDFQVWNGSSSSYSSITALIQALSDSITLRVDEISNRDNANLILQSTFPKNYDEAGLWWNNIGTRAITAAGQGVVNYRMQDDATCEPSTDNQMGACLYAKEIFPSEYIYYDIIAQKTLVTSAGVENLVLEHGAWYTLSWWQKRVSGSHAQCVAYYLHDMAEQIYIDGVASESWKSTHYFDPAFEDSDEWVRHTITFKTRAAWASGETVSIEWRLRLLDTTSAQTPTEYWITRVQLEKGKVATEWKPAPEEVVESSRYQTFFEQSSKLINIAARDFNDDGSVKNTSGIMVKAIGSGIYAQKPNGDLALIGVAVEEGGQTVIKLTADNIKLEGLVTANQKFKILEDGTIVAKDGVFEGEIKSESGTIGGFTIKDDHIGKDVGSGINGLFLYDWMIGFNAPNRQTILGTWNNSGLPILCRLTDTVADEDLPKYGLSIEVRGSLHDNVAIALNGGYVSGFGVKTQTVGLEYVTQNQQPTTPTTTTLNRSVNALYVTTQYYWRARTTDSYATKTIQRNIILPAVTNADDGHMIWIKRGVNDGSSVHIIPNTYTRREVDRIIQSITYYKDVTYPTVFLIDHAEYLSSDLIINSEGDAMCLVFFPDVEVTINGVEYKGGWVQWKNPRNW